MNCSLDSVCSFEARPTISEDFDEREEAWEWQTATDGEKDFFEGEEWEWFGNISRYLVFVTIGFTVLIGVYAAGT